MILVTGGTGFIGSHTVVELLTVGHEVLILDNLSNSRADVVDRIATITGKRPEFVEGDIRDLTEIDDFDHVVFNPPFFADRGYDASPYETRNAAHRLDSTLEDWLAPDPGFLHSVFGWIEGLLIAWMPVYLLIMQKRVYAQGWPMTVLKYCALGFCYTFLLSFAIVASMAIGLVAM